VTEPVPGEKELRVFVDGDPMIAWDFNPRQKAVSKPALTRE